MSKEVSWLSDFPGCGKKERPLGSICVKRLVKNPRCLSLFKPSMLRAELRDEIKKDLLCVEPKIFWLYSDKIKIVKNMFEKRWCDRDYLLRIANLLENDPELARTTLNLYTLEKNVPDSVRRLRLVLISNNYKTIEWLENPTDDELAAFFKRMISMSNYV